MVGIRKGGKGEKLITRSMGWLSPTPFPSPSKAYHAGLLIYEGNFVIVITGTPFAALTGTADSETCSVIQSKLSLKDPMVIRISPNPTNLRFSVENKSKPEMFIGLNWLIGHVKEKGESACKTNFFYHFLSFFFTQTHPLRALVFFPFSLPFDACHTGYDYIGNFFETIVNLYDFYYFVKVVENCVRQPWLK